MLNRFSKWLVGAGVSVVLIALTACSPAPRIEAAFTVEGMTCESCSSAIGETLSAVEGVESASADHIIGSATAVFRSSDVSVDQLVTEIESLGFTVTGTETVEVES